MLARFIVPVSRLDELEGFRRRKEWRISVLAVPMLKASCENRTSPLQIDTIESKRATRWAAVFPRA